MVRLEEFESDKNSFIKQNTGQGGMFFPKHYLLLEVERFAVSLEHFFKLELIHKEDYEYLIMTLKMIKTFLNTHLQINTYDKHLRNRGSNPKRKKKHYKHINYRQLSLFDNKKPFPITGEIVVTGLNENLQALKSKEAEKTGPKFPYKIPAGTYWNNVIIKFLDEERVEIQVKKLSYITDYKEMGMLGKGKVPVPGEQWIFLKILAIYNGEISIKDPDARDKYKKQKQALSETLRNYFSIDYDPFYPYQSSLEKGGNSYKIKLVLLPPPEQAKQNNETVEDITDPLGIHEFLNEEAPQIAED